ncbi:MAG: YwiC-like family protein [Lawsonella clevelandensis]
MTILVLIIVGFGSYVLGNRAGHAEGYQRGYSEVPTPSHGVPTTLYRTQFGQLVLLLVSSSLAAMLPLVNPCSEKYGQREAAQTTWGRYGWGCKFTSEKGRKFSVLIGEADRDTVGKPRIEKRRNGQTRGASPPVRRKPILLLASPYGWPKTRGLTPARWPKISGTSRQKQLKVVTKVRADYTTRRPSGETGTPYPVPASAPRKDVRMAAPQTPAKDTGKPGKKRSLSARGWVPDYHGAWAMVFVPITLGIIIGGFVPPTSPSTCCGGWATSVSSPSRSGSWRAASLSTPPPSKRTCAPVLCSASSPSGAPQATPVGALVCHSHHHHRHPY